MEANDERWNVFIEEHGDLLKKYEKLLLFVNELIEDHTFEEEHEHFREILERIKNGEG